MNQKSKYEYVKNTIFTDKIYAQSKSQMTVANPSLLQLHIPVQYIHFPSKYLQ